MTRTGGHVLSLYLPSRTRPPVGPRRRRLGCIQPRPVFASALCLRLRPMPVLGQLTARDQTPSRNSQQHCVMHRTRTPVAVAGLVKPIVSRAAPFPPVSSPPSPINLHLRSRLLPKMTTPSSSRYLAPQTTPTPPSLTTVKGSKLSSAPAHAFQSIRKSPGNTKAAAVRRVPVPLEHPSRTRADMPARHSTG